MTNNPSLLRFLFKQLGDEVWHRPLVSLVILLMAGLSIVPKAEGGEVFLIGVGLLIAIGIVVWKARCRIAVLLMIVVIGLGLINAFMWRERRFPVNDFTGKAVVLTGVVAREPSPSGAGAFFRLEAETVKRGAHEYAVMGSLPIYAPREIQIRQLDRVEIIGEIVPALSSIRRSNVFLSIGDARLLRVIGQKQETWFAALGRQARVEMVEVFRPLLPDRYRDVHAEMLASILLGTHGAGIPKAIIDAFHQTGTIHVLVVSGSQVSLFFTLVYLPGWLSRWRQRRMVFRQIQAMRHVQDMSDYTIGTLRTWPSPILLIIALVLMCLYACCTQGGAPVARAAIIAGLVGTALVLRQVPKVAEKHSLDIDRYTVLAAAAISILLVEPTALASMGFQLSFAAVAGIAFFAPKLRLLLGFFNDFWAYLFAAPVAAQLATLPFVVWHFGQIPLIGFISNILVVPIAAALLWLGLLTLLATIISSALAWPLGWLSGQLCWLMTRSLDMFFHFPNGMIQVGQVSWLWVMVYCVVVISIGAWLGLVLKPRQDEFADLT